MSDLHPAPATAPLAGYPAGAAVLVAGLPGAGKSTLVARAGGGGHRVLDTDPRRVAWARRLPGIPYGCWRPAMHAAHLVAAWGALGRPGGLVFTEPGTRRIVRAAFLRRAASAGRELHLLGIDASEAEAREGQDARGRHVSPRALRRHARRWQSARTRVLREGFASVRFVSRAGAASLGPLLAPAPGEPDVARALSAIPPVVSA